LDTRRQAIARQCLEGAESGTMTFPQVVGTLMAADFDGYFVDLRLGEATYYLPNGEGLELPTQRSTVAVAAQFNADVVKDAIHEAQALYLQGLLRQGKARRVCGLPGLLLGAPRALLRASEHVNGLETHLFTSLTSKWV
jgi:hypothetical protein